MNVADCMEVSPEKAAACSMPVKKEEEIGRKKVLPTTLLPQNGSDQVTSRPIMSEKKTAIAEDNKKNAVKKFDDKISTQHVPRKTSISSPGCTAIINEQLEILKADAMKFIEDFVQKGENLIFVCVQALLRKNYGFMLPVLCLNFSEN